MRTPTEKERLTFFYGLKCSIIWVKLKESNAASGWKEALGVIKGGL